MKRRLLLLIILVTTLSLCACEQSYTKADLDAAREEGYSKGKAVGVLNRLVSNKQAYDEGYAAGKAEGYEGYNEIVYEYNKALDLLDEAVELLNEYKELTDEYATLLQESEQPTELTSEYTEDLELPPSAQDFDPLQGFEDLRRRLDEAERLIKEARNAEVLRRTLRDSESDFGW